MLEIEEMHAENGLEQTGFGAANLKAVEECEAGEEVLALYQSFRSRFGRSVLPGIVKCFATHPAMLKSMIDLAAEFLFVDGYLTRRHKEMIATLISSENECPYCAHSHGSLLLMRGASEQVVAALRTAVPESPCFTQPEQALLRFSLKVNSDSPSITRADVERAMRYGWSEAQVAEAIHVAALFAAFNRIANAFGLASPNANFREAGHV